jgi:hypothetical protein
MSGLPQAHASGDQFCRACGLAMLTHMRCLGCGILTGPLHVESSLSFGLCSTCARRDPKLRISRGEWLRLRERDGGSQPPLSGTKHRRGRLDE